MLVSRWAQETLLKYARREFGLDGLSENLLEPVDPAEPVVNPQWWLLDRLLNRARTQRARRSGRQALADCKARHATPHHIAVGTRRRRSATKS